MKVIIDCTNNMSNIILQQYHKIIMLKKIIELWLKIGTDNNSAAVFLYKRIYKLINIFKLYNVFIYFLLKYFNFPLLNISQF